MFADCHSHLQLVTKMNSVAMMAHAFLQTKDATDATNVAICQMKQIANLRADPESFSVLPVNA